MPEYVYQIVVEEERGPPHVEYLTNRLKFSQDEFHGIVRAALNVVTLNTQKTALVDIAVDLFKRLKDHYGFSTFQPQASYKFDSLP